MFETIALSVITALLLILLVSRKAGTVKLLLGILTAAAAIASLVFYVLMLRASGGPAAGKETLQLYVPCGAYLLVTAFSLIMAGLSRRKLRLDKAAKQAKSPKAEGQ